MRINAIPHDQGKSWLFNVLYEARLHHANGTTIDTIRFSTGVITEADMRYISVKDLEIRSILFYCVLIKPKEMRALVEQIRWSKTISTIEFTEFSIDDIGLEILCESLLVPWKAEGRMIERLDLSNNSITDKALKYLIPFVSSIEFLEIEGCPFLTENGVVALFKAIASPESKLTKLNVSEIQMDSRGYMRLLECLKGDNGLTELHFDTLRFSTSEFRAIACLLMQENRLMSLSHVGEGDEREVYEELLMDNYTIQDLYISGGFSKKISQLCQRNKQLFMYFRRLSFLLADIEKNRNFAFFSHPLMDRNLLNVIFSYISDDYDVSSLNVNKLPTLHSMKFF